MKVVAIKERSEGNDSVGSMWLETKIFEPTATVLEVLEWAGQFAYPKNAATGGKWGKLMLTVAEEPSK